MSSVGRARRSQGRKRAFKAPDGAVPARLLKTCERRAARIRARAAEDITAGKTQDQEFRHPGTAAYLQGLTDAEAAKRSLLIRERGGICTRYWRDGGRVRCREVAADEASVGPEIGVLHAAAEAEFGRTLPRTRAELRSD